MKKKISELKCMEYFNESLRLEYSFRVVCDTCDEYDILFSNRTIGSILLSYIPSSLCYVLTVHIDGSIALLISKY